MIADVTTERLKVELKFERETVGINTEYNDSDLHRKQRGDLRYRIFVGPLSFHNRECSYDHIRG